MFDPRRIAVVAEAKTWLETPFHHGQCLKGHGVDCLRFLAGVYEASGIIGPIDIPHYEPDQMLHSDDELYLEGVRQIAAEIPGPPLPGDIVLFKWGRIMGHGAIVVEWPRLIHAYVSQARVCYGSAELKPFFGRETRFFSPFEDV